MNIEELSKALNNLGISPDEVTLDQGPHKDNSWVLELSWNHVNNTKYPVWDVFYIDRGNRNNLESFYTEGEACNCLYNNIKKYHNK